MASHGMGESTINHKPSLKHACREHYSWHALHQQGLDTTTPAGKAMFQMLGVFAQHHPGTSPCGPSACQGKTNPGRPIPTASQGRRHTGYAELARGRPGIRKIAARFGALFINCSSGSKPARGQPKDLAPREIPYRQAIKIAPLIKPHEVIRFVKDMQLRIRDLLIEAHTVLYSLDGVLAPND